MGMNMQECRCKSRYIYIKNVITWTDGSNGCGYVDYIGNLYRLVAGIMNMEKMDAIRISEGFYQSSIGKSWRGYGKRFVLN